MGGAISLLLSWFQKGSAATMSTANVSDGRATVISTGNVSNGRATVISTANISNGPCGGTGGFPFDMVVGGDNVLSTVRVRHGGCIDAIQVVCRDDGGSMIEFPRWGGAGGRLDQILLGSKEYLVSIKGRHGKQGVYSVIKSLSFVSNLRTYGPYGSEEGDPFTLTATETGKIVGFHGRYGMFLDAIGIHAKVEFIKKSKHDEREATHFHLSP